MFWLPPLEFQYRIWMHKRCKFFQKSQHFYFMNTIILLQNSESGLRPLHGRVHQWPTVQTPQAECGEGTPQHRPCTILLARCSLRFIAIQTSSEEGGSRGPGGGGRWVIILKKEIAKSLWSFDVKCITLYSIVIRLMKWYPYFHRMQGPCVLASVCVGLSGV